jgi:hypothetical protein
MPQRNRFNAVDTQKPKATQTPNTKHQTPALLHLLDKTTLGWSHQAV